MRLEWVFAGWVGLTLAWLVTAFWLGQQKRRNIRLEMEAGLERVRAERAADDLAALKAINLGLVEEAPAAMFLVTPDGRVSYFNRSAGRLFRLNPRLAEDKPFIELVGNDELAASVQGALTGSPPEAPLEVQPPGSKLILQATTRAIRNERGQLLGAALILEDLTGLRQLEAARRDLVANVSHELRTPLAGMKALIETLESGVDDREVAAAFLSQLHAEVDRLALLVRDLLELSRIESGGIQLRIEAVGLADTLNNAVARLRAEAEEGGIVLEIEPSVDVRVLADPSRCEQVVVNLLQNAIKFTQPGGRVIVGWAIDEREATVRVRDTGIGIEDQDLPRIFERFYKADKARVRSNSSGTGLGLAIVKHLITVMDGRVWAESARGVGSTFSFTLPLASHRSRLRAAPVLGLVETW